MMCPYCHKEAKEDFTFAGVPTHVCEKAPKNQGITFLNPKDWDEQPGRPSATIQGALNDHYNLRAENVKYEPQPFGRRPGIYRSRWDRLRIWVRRWFWWKQ